ncbi:MAG: DUF1330 domain-containing protein [Paracoccaceae bacterium]
MSDEFGHSFVQDRRSGAASRPKGYWIISVDVMDQARYQTYLEMAVDAIDRLGGDIIIRTSEGVVCAGEPKRRNVIVQFPSYAAAVAASQDVAQKAAMLMYEGIASYDMTVVEGFVEV